jgi:sialate O-acetylesterase
MKTLLRSTLRSTPFKLLATVAVLGSVACDRALANAKLPAFFSDGMVLQREARVPIWGTADVGEVVTVSVAGQTVRSTADAAGKWMVDLAPLPVGAPLEVAVEGKNKLKVRDVLVGEVWLASGQSNMRMAVKDANDATAEMAAANYPQVRMFRNRLGASAVPLTDAPGKWLDATPTNVGDFSAAAYFFAREVHQKLGVPVGILHTSWGGTVIESWTPPAALKTDEDFKVIFDRWQRYQQNYPAAKADYDVKKAAWVEAAAAAKAAGKEPPKEPAEPMSPDSNYAHMRPGSLYNAMIAPFVPYAIRGFLWYQGEYNAPRAYEYRKLFPNLIRSWRTDWNQELPFLFVQLANYKDPVKEPGDAQWAELREAQLMALALPRTGMATAVDVGENWDIHPKNKQAVGHRLALVALAQVYGQNIPYSGPLYDSMTVEGNTIRLRFKHTHGGLVAKDGLLKSFAIASEDKKWVWADVRIDGETVVVSSPAVANPVAVRYAWADNPPSTLYNGADLPASPFRTDDWPLSTQIKP